MNSFSNNTYPDNSKVGYLKSSPLENILPRHFRLCKIIQGPLYVILGMQMSSHHNISNIQCALDGSVKNIFFANIYKLSNGLTA